jgi:ankyrin repeat protein
MPLLLAISNGYKTVVKLLFIRDNIDLNSKDKFGATLLLLAVEYRSKVVVEPLLTRDNVNLDSKSALRDIPLL